MKLTASKENAKMLAAILDIDESQATALLDVTVLITPAKDDVSSFMAAQLHNLLSRTVSKVVLRDSYKEKPIVEVIIGNQSSRSESPKIWVSLTEEQIMVSIVSLESKVIPSLHPALILLGACYVAASVLKIVMGNSQDQSDVIINYHELLGDDIDLFKNEVDLANSYLAGAGAIGNAFLYALQFFNVKGQLYIVDPKRISEGNLNRCMFFNRVDVGFFKAERLSIIAQPFFKKLKLTSYNTTLRNVPERSDGPWLKKLIVCVDSRRTRRSLQSEIPGEVFDASTTDIREIVLHFNKQPTTKACLSCIYYEEPDELAHEKHVAEVLGVTINDVQKGFITQEIAEKISTNYQALNPHEIVGKAFDSLFKQLCGEGTLRKAGDRQVLAPFSFISVLAGTYLAIEVIIRVQKPQHDKRFNYWRVSPWASPVPRLRSFRPRRTNCEFCGDDIKKRVAESLWRK